MDAHIPPAGSDAHCHACYMEQKAAREMEKAKALAKEQEGERNGPALLAAFLVLAAIAGLWSTFLWLLVTAFG
ncbi:hypothetical protein A8W25_30665 [Streptomyces sp. ERV7]|uniref:hypothetical protein n=1 Tax=Streptomyces sp. ERV7 TaxID=1322334 RepID=UPI0007F43909|nr:hypothetical protein [Streptomyces sp. ERV7]OAR21894.1 hypothetical protein A8W25_30665 [Streptomyces sp. ERV7]